MFTTHRLSVGDIDMWNLQNSLTEQILYTLINAKADQFYGEGANSRNGYHDRTIEICTRSLNLRMPKLRTKRFFPENVLEATSARKGHSSQSRP